MGARLRAGFWLLCATSLGAGLLELSSCTDDPALEATDAAADDGGRKGRDAVPEETPDASDAGKRPAPVLPGCVGTSLPLSTAGERAYVSVALGFVDAGGDPADAGDGGDAGDAGAPTPIRGDFLLDFGANGSTIDLAAFKVPPTPVSCLGDAGAPGALCSFADFDFFGPWGTVSLVTANYGFLFNSVKQAGIVGTDFLSVYPFTVEFTNARIWRGSTTEFCSDAQLLAAGFSPIPAAGFYTNDFGKLRPLSDVLKAPDAATTANFTVPNVPTVPITIAGVAALAQLDTGYDDRIVRHSININQPMLDRLLAESPDKLSRRTSKDLFLTTCVPGLSQRGTAYYLEPGTPVNFVGTGGGVARADTGTVVFVKERLDAAERCGGIETWTVPAAQMGASFLVDAQAAIFDPVSSRVWLPKE